MSGDPAKATAQQADGSDNVPAWDTAAFKREFGLPQVRPLVRLPDEPSGSELFVGKVDTWTGPKSHLGGVGFSKVDCDWVDGQPPRAAELLVNTAIRVFGCLAEGAGSTAGQAGLVARRGRGAAFFFPSAAKRMDVLRVAEQTSLWNSELIQGLGVKVFTPESVDWERRAEAAMAAGHNVMFLSECRSKYAQGYDAPNGLFSIVVLLGQPMPPYGSPEARCRKVRS